MKNLLTIIGILFFFVIFLYLFVFIFRSPDTKSLFPQHQPILNPVTQNVLEKEWNSNEISFAPSISNCAEPGEAPV